MTTLRGVASTLSVFLLGGALAACGGGGGGGSTGGGGVVPVATPTPTPTPIATLAPAGFVPPTGAITIVAGSGGSLGSALVPSSADGVLLAQAPSTPTQPPSSGSLATFPVNVKENAGQTPTAAQRAASAQRATDLARHIAADRSAVQADTLRERTPSVESVRRTMAGIRAVRGLATQSVRRTQAAQGVVGTKRDFKIVTSNIGNSGGCAGGTTAGTYQCNVTIHTTLQAVGAHGNVWVDDASLATPGEYLNPSSDFQTVAADFDSYYATETAAFGPAFFPNTPTVTFTYNASLGQCDATGTQLPRSQWIPTSFSGANGTSIDIVITDALAGTGEGGYYYSVNEIPQEVFNCGTAPKAVSNNTSMFVVAGNNYSSGPNLPQFNESFWINTDIPRTLSHELQHLLHEHNKVALPEVSGGTPVFDDTFIDEGCSMLAEDLAADGVHIDTPRYTYSFLLEPSLFSLTSFTGYQPNPTSTASNPPYGWYSNTGGSYGQAYLFLRYLYDRFGQSSALKAIYASTAPGIGPALAAAGGEAFPKLYDEFAVAIAAQSSPVAAPPLYGFSSQIVLRGTVTVPSRRSPPLNVRTLTFGGPQPPETFANNLPTGTLTIAPGTNASTFIVDGGTLFLPASNNSSTGAAIVVSGSTAPNFQGALVQGALPTPAPNSQ